MGEPVLLQIRADDAEAARVVGMTGADLVLLRHVVKFNPGAVLPGHDALGPEDAAVLAAVQGGENFFDARLGEGLGGLLAPGGEDLVGVVVMVVAGTAGVVTLLPVVMGVPVLPVVVMVLMFPVSLVLMGVLMLPMFPVVMMVLMFPMLPMVMVGMFRLLGLVLRPHLGQELVRH